MVDSLGRFWHVGSRETRVTEDTSAALLTGKAVVADRSCCIGKQSEFLQGMDQGRDEDAMNAIQEQMCIFVQRKMLGEGVTHSDTLFKPAIAHMLWG